MIDLLPVFVELEIRAVLVVVAADAKVFCSGALHLGPCLRQFLLADRLGVCDAARCDRVYVDTSRNGARRFCSTACQNRTKAAAFRTRSRTEAPEG